MDPAPHRPGTQKLVAEHKNTGPVRRHMVRAQRKSLRRTESLAGSVETSSGNKNNRRATRRRRRGTHDNWRGTKERRRGARNHRRGPTKKGRGTPRHRPGMMSHDPDSARSRVGAVRNLLGPADKRRGPEQQPGVMADHSCGTACNHEARCFTVAEQSTPWRFTTTTAHGHRCTVQIQPDSSGVGPTATSPGFRTPQCR